MKFGLGVSSFLIVTLAVTVWQTSAQAPGDEDRRCLDRRDQAGDVYPPDVRMLMDSRNYEELISGSRPHWQALDADGSGRGWRSTFGGPCVAEPRSCEFSQTTSGNNWFFTQYIRYLDAREVFINVSTSFFQCVLSPSCSKRYVDVYRYERNERNDAAARTTSNYGQPIQRIQLPNGFVASELNEPSFTFTPSGNFNGFYIAVRDTGTCVDLRRFQVYYNKFTPVAPLPVICPETGLPPAGTTASVTCSCPANSVATSSLQLTCSSDGTCVGNPSCQCLEGYQEFPEQCRACPNGTYRSQSDPADSCLQCPPNTDTSGVAVASCPCIAGYFRASQEGPEIGCSQPPTAVRNLRVTGMTHDSITIEWDPPLRTGRPDYYYVIEFSNPDDISSYIRHNEVANHLRGITSYTLDGMESNTNYIIRVTVQNGVSDQDEQNAAGRTKSISSRTNEGPPGPPSNVNGLCNVVLWGQPSEPNGVITGFEVQFYIPDVRYGAVNDKGVNDIFHVVQESDKPTGYPDSQVSVGVRAISGGGDGVWANVSLGCDDVEPIPIVFECPECPTTLVTQPAQIESISVFYDEDQEMKVAAWKSPGGEVTSYSVRLSYGFFGRQYLSSENPWIDLRLTDLPTQRPLYIEVRARNSAGSAPWSSRATLCASMK